MPTETDAELAALIRETRQELRDLLKSEDAALAKDDDKSAPPADDKKEDSAPPADSTGDSSSAPPPPAASASPAAPPAPPADPSAGAPPTGDPASAPPADPAASADPAAAAGSAGGDSVETLVAAYSQLAAQPGGPEMLRAHFMALKQVIAQTTGAVDPAASAPPAPAAPPAAPPAPAATPDAAPPGLPPEGMQPDLAMKNEKELLEKLGKAEGELASMKKDVANMAVILEKFTRKPERKGLTGKDVAALTKSEPVVVDPTKLKKDELNKKLAEIAKNPELKKSDRDLINDYFGRKVKVADLAPLFEKK